MGNSLDCKKIKLNANQLKLIAALTMLVDHVGYFLLPQFLVLRMIGRISYPIFAYFIVEGCKYTKHPLRYWKNVGGLGVACMLVTYIATDMWYANVLITFTMSIGLILGLKKCKTKLIYVVPCLGWLLVCVTITQMIEVDYGFLGAMVPVCIWFGEELEEYLHKQMGRTFPCKLFGMTIGLLLLSIAMGGIQYLCLISIPLLRLYDGTVGQKNWKAFFYVFYPAHIGIIQLIDLLCFG